MSKTKLFAWFCLPVASHALTQFRFETSAGPNDKEFPFFSSQKTRKLPIPHVLKCIPFDNNTEEIEKEKKSTKASFVPPHPENALQPSMRSLRVFLFQESPQDQSGDGPTTERTREKQHTHTHTHIILLRRKDGRIPCSVCQTANDRMAARCRRRRQSLRVIFLPTREKRKRKRKDERRGLLVCLYTFILSFCFFFLLAACHFFAQQLFHLIVSVNTHPVPIPLQLITRVPSDPESCLPTFLFMMITNLSALSPTIPFSDKLKF